MENRSISRFGAIAQMLSVSTIPIPLVGPMDDCRMLLSGYAFLGTPANSIRQTETYKLARPNNYTSQWKGELIIVQQPESDDSDFPRTELIFDARMKLDLPYD